jgi:hypothetical protein
MIEVYVDNFMSLVIPVSREQLRHVANAIMHGIHDVFLPDKDDSNDPISEKNYLRVKADLKPGRRCSGSTSMVRVRRCGWKRQNAKSCSPSLRDGYGQERKDWRVSRSENLNLRLQKFDMHSCASQRGEDCCHHATGYYDADQSMSIYKGTVRSKPQ